MNVIPPYGRPALFPLGTSMDDSEKEFTSILSVDGNARSQGKSMFPAKLPSHTVSLILQHTPCWTQAPKKLNDPILLDILITQCRIHRAWLLNTHLQSALIIGAIVRRQQELLVVHRYPSLLPVTWIQECLDHLMWTIYLVWCCIAVL